MTTTVMTGSGSGIGAATKARLEADGHQIIGVDLQNADIIADLSTREGRRDAVKEILDRSGGAIDHLVAAAGIGGHVGDCSKIVAVNYFGATSVLDGCLAALQKGNSPSAVVVCSNSAKLMPAVDDFPSVQAMLEGDEARAVEEIEKVGVGDLAYMASKNAIGQAIRRRAMEWGQAGVRLNAIAPGPVLTPLLQGSLDTPGTGDLIRALEMPLGRWGEPSEIAGVIAFLLGPDASFVHGSVYFADGGMDAHTRPQGY